MSDPREILARELLRIADPDFVRARAFVRDQGGELLGDVESLRRLCLTSAGQGDPDAQHAFAVLVYHGWFGEPDPALAYAWCDKAASQGHLPAMHKLARLRLDEPSAAPDLREQSMAALTDLAQKGYAPALRSLGTRYAEGIAMRADAAMAMSCFEKAAEAGDAYAQGRLGNMLLRSPDADSVSRGVRWLQAAADGGFSPAMQQIAYFHRHGDHGYPKDPEKATALGEQAERLLQV